MSENYLHMLKKLTFDIGCFLTFMNAEFWLKSVLYEYIVLIDFDDDETLNLKIKSLSSMLLMCLSRPNLNSIT